MVFQFLFKWQHFFPEIILLNVRWYCRCLLNYQDLEKTIAGQGAIVNCTTIYPWMLEQDSRNIKQFTKPMMSFGAIRTARQILSGIKAISMIRKEQVSEVGKGGSAPQATFLEKLSGVVA